MTPIKIPQTNFKAPDIYYDTPKCSVSTNNETQFQSQRHQYKLVNGSSTINVGTIRIIILATIK